MIPSRDPELGYICKDSYSRYGYVLRLQDSIFWGPHLIHSKRHEKWALRRGQGRRGRGEAEGTFRQEKPAVLAQHSLDHQISFWLLKPQVSCGYPDRAFHHLWCPHHCLFSKARHHEQPIFLRAPRCPCASDPPRSPSPGGRRRCPAFPPQAQGKGWVPKSLHFLTSLFPEPSFPPPQILPVGVWAISSDGAHSQPWQKMLSEMENLQDAWVRTRI